MKRLGVFTSVCEEDARWVPQYLGEIERLGTPFAMHLDRCSPETKAVIISHPLCIGTTSQDDPKIEYTEQHKQGPMDLLRISNRFSWALHWDIDEVWEKDAPKKLASVLALDVDYAQVTWLNLWNDVEHIRIDGVFNYPPRVKLYNLKGGRYWYFDHAITYGGKMLDLKKVKEGCRLRDCMMEGVGKGFLTDITCLHHGNITRELREFHKARWDRIYSAAVGSNPLGFWNLLVDEVNHPPVVVRHDYL